MSLKLMYITNNPDIAIIAENSGVDWIFIDLEINGKELRQGHLDSVISKHNISDIKPIKQVITKSKLLVRVNPIYEKSEEEINQVIDNGADIVMLPFFKNEIEVREFIKLVNKRAEICLLLETPEAVENLDCILDVNGIDYIHIGLNDLHLGYKKKFMFELLIDGTVEKIITKIKRKHISYGFGGIAQLGQGLLSAEYIIAEHYRLGSTMAILSRSFCDLNKIKEYDKIEKLFTIGLQNIRLYEDKLKEKSNRFRRKQRKNKKNN